MYSTPCYASESDAGICHRSSTSQCAHPQDRVLRHSPSSSVFRGRSFSWRTFRFSFHRAYPDTQYANLFRLLTFFIAISWVCFHATGVITRVITSITMLVIVVLLSGIISNRECQSERDVNSLASSMERMRKLVKGARRHSARHWRTFSQTLVAWPVTTWQKRKPAKTSSRSSRASSGNNLGMSQVSLSTANLPRIVEVTREVPNAFEEGSPAAPPGLSSPLASVPP